MEICIYESRLISKNTIESSYHTDNSFFKEMPGNLYFDNGDITWNCGRSKINTIGKKFLFLRKDSDYLSQLLATLKDKGHTTINLSENDFIDELEAVTFSSSNCFKGKSGKCADVIYLLDSTEILLLKNEGFEKKSIYEELLTSALKQLKQLSKNEDTEALMKHFKALARLLIAEAAKLDSVDLLKDISSYLNKLSDE